MKPVSAKSSLDVGIVVQDINASLEFYLDILGFNAVGELILPFGHLHRLSYGDSFLKLLVPNHRIVAKPEHLTARAGIQYITLQISNILEFSQSVLEREIPIEMPLQELLPGLSVIMIRDPDGNIVELIERA